MRTYTRKRPEHRAIEGVLELCRLCLSKAEDAVPIFSEDTGNVCASLALRIMMCVGLEVTQEECLPNHICSTCHGELQNYYAFRKKCEVSYQKLKSHLLAMQMKEYREELEAMQKSETEKCDVKEDNRKLYVEKSDNSIVFMVNMDGTLRLCNEPSLTQEQSSIITRINAEPIVLRKTVPQSSIPIIETINRLAQNNEKVVESNRILESTAVTESKKINTKSNGSLIKSYSLIAPFNKTVCHSNKTVEQSNKIIDQNNKPIDLNNKTIVQNKETIAFNNERVFEIDQNNKPIDLNNKTIVENKETIAFNNEKVIESSKTISESNKPVYVNKNNEVQVQDEVAHPGLDLPKFLSNKLIEIGILSRQDNGLELLDNDTRTLELETGDGSRITLLLIEEDEGVENDNAKTENVEQRPNTTKGKWTDYIEDIDCKDGKSRARCGWCGRGFASRGAAARHVRARHARARPHACNVCGRAFAQKEVCARHELVHQEKRPFACHSCPKSFTQRGALSAHARAHAPPHARALQLYRCTTCPKVFLYSSGLSRHMMAHSGRVYTCAGCQRAFRDKSSLKRHLRSSRHAPLQPAGVPQQTTGSNTFCDENL